MSTPLLVGLLLLLAAVVFAASIRRGSAKSPAGTQTIDIMVVVMAVVGIQVYMILGRA